MNWQQAHITDAAKIAAVAESIHPDFPEDLSIFANKLALFPLGCLCLQGEQGAIGGYVISHPWRLGSPPALNTPIPTLPEQPNSYYLHDIALLPQYQGKGYARKVLQKLEALCRESGLDNITLLSVGGADGFWRGMGFEDISHLTSAEKLASYGNSAVYMRKWV